MATPIKSLPQPNEHGGGQLDFRKTQAAIYLKKRQLDVVLLGAIHECALYYDTVILPLLKSVQIHFIMARTILETFVTLFDVICSEAGCRGLPGKLIVTRGRKYPPK